MMKCPGCGAEVADGAKTCSACGHEFSMSSRAVGETKHVGKEAGVVAGKVAHGVVGGVKGFASGAKKGYKGEEKDDEAKAS